MRKPPPARTLADRLSLVAGLIIVLLPFQAFFTTWLGSNTGHLDLVRIWKEIVICLMAVLTAWLVFRHKPLRGAIKHDIFKLIGLYCTLHILLGIVAVLDHRVTASALLYALIVNLRFVVFFTVCYVLAARSTILARTWPKLLLVPAAIVIVFGLLQLVLPINFLSHFGYGPTTIPAYQTVDQNLSFQRIQSTLRGANPLGAYLVLIIPASLIILRGWKRILLAGGAVIALFFTYSRSAWLGLLAAVGLYGLQRVRGHRLFKEIVAIAAVLVLVAGLAVFTLRTNQAAQDTFFHTSANSKNVSSNNERAKAMKQGFHDVVHEPLGEGPGTAGPASVRNSGHPTRIAENYYLQIGQEVGWVGLFLFTVINFLVLRMLWFRRAEPLALILLVSFIGISAVNLVSHAWTDDTLSLIWWGLAGLATVSAKTSVKMVPVRK